jgi:hypothetical protein
MARRAQSKVPVTAILVGLVLIGLVAFVGWKVAAGSRQVDFPSLNINEFRANSLSLRGNRYTLEGIVDRRERVAAGGQMVTLNVAGAAGDEPVPVMIPAGLKDANIEGGFQMKFVVRVNKDGIPEAEEIRN